MTNDKEFRAQLRADYERKHDLAKQANDRWMQGEGSLEDAQTAERASLDALNAYLGAVDAIGTEPPNRLRAYREGIGITQQRLADLCGVSRETISRIETGRNEPGVGLALQIAAQLGVPAGVIWPVEGIRYDDAVVYAGYLQSLGWTVEPPQCPV
ncbi:MAG: helix-turn-helix transcriptional regulator [Coriobacteriales bacterium]